MKEAINYQTKRDACLQLILEINRRYDISFEDMAAIARRILCEEGTIENLARQDGEIK
jgi:hypothetical protein